MPSRSSENAAARFADQSPLRRLFARTIRPPYVWARSSLVSALERRHGISTAGAVELTELGLAAEGRISYRPAGWFILRRLLSPKSVTEEDVFIDFGSGMGRVVFQAARYPFKRVIGVELSPELNEVARANIARTRDRHRSQHVELVNADVLDYQIPDDVTVAFFANPFTGEIFRSVIDRLLASVDHNPRRLRIIYVNPIEHELLMATGRVRAGKRLRGLRPSRGWSRSNSTRTYEVLPRPMGSAGDRA